MNFCELKAIMTNIVSYMPPGLYGETPTYIFFETGPRAVFIYKLVQLNVCGRYMTIQQNSYHSFF